MSGREVEDCPFIVLPDQELKRIYEELVIHRSHTLPWFRRASAKQLSVCSSTYVAELPPSLAAWMGVLKATVSVVISFPKCVVRRDLSIGYFLMSSIVWTTGFASKFSLNFYIKNRLDCLEYMISGHSTLVDGSITSTVSDLLGRWIVCFPALVQLEFRIQFKLKTKQTYPRKKLNRKSLQFDVCTESGDLFLFLVFKDCVWEDHWGSLVEVSRTIDELVVVHCAHPMLLYLKNSNNGTWIVNKPLMLG